MTFQKTPKNSGRRRTLEQVRKDARAAELYRTGLTLQQVADEMGCKSKTTVFNMVQRAIRDAQKDAIDGKDAFTMILDSIRDDIKVLNDVISNPSPLTSPSGKVITRTDPKTGEEVPVPDKGQITRAVTERRHHLELQAKLLDVVPASRSRVEVVTEDVVDREIEKLAKELADAGKKVPVAPESPGNVTG